MLECYIGIELHFIIAHLFGDLFILIRFIEDAADVDDRNLEHDRQAQEMAFKRQSQVVQRNLPIPADINEDILKEPQNIEQEADETIKKEMLQMIKHDKGLHVSNYTRFSDDEMRAAKVEFIFTTLFAKYLH